MLCQIQNASKVCLDFKLINAFNSLFCSSCSLKFFNCFSLELSLTRLLRLVSLAQWATKLPFSLAQEQTLLPPGNWTWVFSCPELFDHSRNSATHPRIWYASGGVEGWQQSVTNLLCHGNQFIVIPQHSFPTVLQCYRSKMTTKEASVKTYTKQAITSKCHSDLVDP